MQVIKAVRHHHQQRLAAAVRTLFALCLLLLTGSCEQTDSRSENFSDCPYDRPEAVFYPELPQISDHQFRQAGRGSEESFRLAGDITVVLLQYGCQYRSQEFRFTLPRGEQCRSAADCVDLTVSLLQMLARLGPEYHTFRAWAQAIYAIADQIQLGDNAALDDRFWVRIDQQQQSGRTTLSLVLSEDPDG